MGGQVEENEVGRCGASTAAPSAFGSSPVPGLDASHSVTNAGRTPGPWFVSGVRFRMNGGEWHAINRYDPETKKDQNIACVGFDPRTGEGLADAAFIARACNSHDDLLEACRAAEEWLSGWASAEPYIATICAAIAKAENRT